MRRLVHLATLAAACSLAVLVGTTALAGAAVPKTAAALDGSYTGTTGSWTSLTVPSLSVSPSELGPGGSATFTTTITATQYAAEWTCTTLCHPELIVVGFGHGRGNSRLRGDGSLLYGQDNSMGTGYCSNDEFYQGPTFVFGTGAQCYSHGTPPGSTETYKVTITGTNTFTDTVTSSTGTLHASFAGTLGSTPTTTYTPAIYLLPGRTATDLTTPWTFTVATSTYTVSS